MCFECFRWNLIKHLHSSFRFTSVNCYRDSLWAIGCTSLHQNQVRSNPIEHCAGNDCIKNTAWAEVFEATNPLGFMCRGQVCAVTLKSRSHFILAILQVGMCHLLQLVFLWRIWLLTHWMWIVRFSAGAVTLRYANLQLAGRKIILVIVVWGYDTIVNKNIRLIPKGIVLGNALHSTVWQHSR